MNINFSKLKTNIVLGSEPSSAIGRKSDLSDHLEMLKREFSGKPEILYYHAEVIVRIRRGENLFSHFKELWCAETDFLLSNLNLRWLISACDTIVDHGESQAERHVALAASLMGAIVKLYETERSFSDNNVNLFSKKTDKDLFDGLTSYQVGYGDLVENLAYRIQRSFADGGLAWCIFKEIYNKLYSNDTVLHRMKSKHKLDASSWLI